MHPQSPKHRRDGQTPAPLALSRWGPHLVQLESLTRVGHLHHHRAAASRQRHVDLTGTVARSNGIAEQFAEHQEDVVAVLGRHVLGVEPGTGGGAKLVAFGVIGSYGDGQVTLGVVVSHGIGRPDHATDDLAGVCWEAMMREDMVGLLASYGR